MKRYVNGILLLYTDDTYDFFPNDDHKDNDEQIYKKIHPSFKILRCEHIGELTDDQHANEGENEEYLKIPFACYQQNKDDPK